MRVIAAFLLLPLAIAAERFAWYASRSVAMPRIHELGGTHDDMTALYTASLIGGVIGGILAVALLPRIVLVAGAAAAAFGYIFAGRADDLDGFVTGMRIAGFGAGAMKVALYGLALVVIPTPRLRMLYIIATYLVINLASVVAGAAGSWLFDTGLGDAGFIVLGVIVTAGAVPAVAVIVVDKLALHDPMPRVHHGRAVLASLAMIACTMPLFAAMSSYSTRLFELMKEDAIELARIGLVHSAMTFVTMAAMVALAVYLLTPGGKRHSTSFLIGAAVAVGAAGALVAVVPTLPTLILGGALLSIAEVAAPLALARGLANHHPRVVTLVAAFTLAFSWSASGWPSAAAAYLPVALLGVAAFVLLRFGVRFDDWLDAAPPAPAPPTESWLSGRGAELRDAQPGGVGR